MGELFIMEDEAIVGPKTYAEVLAEMGGREMQWCIKHESPQAWHDSTCQHWQLRVLLNQVSGGSRRLISNCIFRTATLVVKESADG